MPTILSFLSGRQITNDSGVPQAGAQLFHYRATTLTALTVWQDSGATVPHAQPVACDAGGYVPLIYVDDTFAWKVIIKSSVATGSVTLKTYDNLQAAEASAAAVGFAPTLLPWNQKTSASSPIALTAADAGNAYEADTTGGSITFNLPGAASVGNGKGFFFKKTAAPNSMIIDPFGSETIDDVSASLSIGGKDTIVGIFSNGAEWYRVDGYLDAVALGPLLPGLQSVQVFTATGTWTKPSGIAAIIAIGTGGGAGGATNATGNRQGGGGGAGGTGIKFIDVTAIASVAVTVGTGGAGGASGGNVGIAGNATTFGAHFTANGGGAGQTVNNVGAGGTATGADLNITGGEGSGIDTAGGTDSSGIGGASFWGGGGGSVAGTQAGRAGTAFGSGGSGAANNSNSGGAGKDGVVWVLEFGS